MPEAQCSQSAPVNRSETGPSEQSLATGPCASCGHDTDAHMLVATGDDPSCGGIVVCPQAGCACFRTWTPEGVPESVVRVPPLDELMATRARLQGLV